MRVVHFANNALAGAPLLIVQALNAHTSVQARLVDLRRYGSHEQGWFEYDLVFGESRDECLALAEQADIIHLHNLLDIHSRDFAPLDFAALEQRGKRVLRHFHSLPSLVAERTGVSEQAVLDDPLPCLAVGHYPERFHPRAKVVLNPIPIHEPHYRPSGREPEVDLVYSPSKPYAAWENRWNTKGMPQVCGLLERLGQDCGAVHELVHGRSLREVMAAKQRARLVIDDLCNGSIHLSGLEGLSVGRAVAAFLDARQMRVLAELLGATELPWINLRLEEAEAVLRSLLADRDLCAELGRASRVWMERWFDPARIAGQYQAAYQELLETGALARQPALALDTPAKRFLAVEVHEAAWRSRAQCCQAYEKVGPAPDAGFANAPDLG